MSSSQVTDPVLFDTNVAKIHAEYVKAWDAVDHAYDLAHFFLGDKKVYGNRDRQGTWRLHRSEVEAKLVELYESGDVPVRGHRPSTYMGRIADAAERKTALGESLEKWDAEYKRLGSWPRYILCNSSNGHIHNAAGCHTLGLRSSLTWLVDMSGTEVEDFIAAKGKQAMILCTHCFPEAPVEWTRSAKDVRDEESADKVCAGSNLSPLPDSKRRGNYRPCRECGEYKPVTQYGVIRKHNKPGSK